MNAWSLLYEELDMSINIKEGDPQDFWYEDGISLVGNTYITDTIFIPEILGISFFNVFTHVKFLIK